MDKNQQFRLDIERAMFADNYEILSVGDEDVVLVVQQSTSPFSRGTAVIIGDAGRAPLGQDNLAPLADYLNSYGWVTMLISAPTVGLDTLPGADNNAPAADEKITSVMGQTSIDPLAFEQQEQLLIARLQTLKTKSEAYPGFFIVIGQGTTAAWLSKLYSEEKLEVPDALIVISPYWPQRDYNKRIAQQLAQTTMPVLDIYSPWDNEWSLHTQQQRLIAATRSLKLHYRQRQLIGQAFEPQQHRYISKEIYGWLSHMGW